MRSTRVIAFYLPQYHPVPANDAFWGKGFTEWTNVTKAQPLFPGHQQPHLPSDLGFYDLRVPEVREQQAELARQAGIEGFCYWHYWFGNGERVLERVFEEVLSSGSPDFPFCLGWANESWTGKWHGLENEKIFEQLYPGKVDYENHFKTLLPAFHDPRYIRVHNKPLFIIFRPDLLPSCHEFCAYWNQLANEHELPGFHFVANGGQQDPASCHRDGLSGFARNEISTIIEDLRPKESRPAESILYRLKKVINKKLYPHFRPTPDEPHIMMAAYSDYVESSMAANLETSEYPVIYPNWDNTPRMKNKGYILSNPTAEQFGKLLTSTIGKLHSRHPEEQIIFLKSWNEWAEGNMIEPSRLHGNSYIEECSIALKVESRIR